jgi:Gly-Xaa carboxypeptidase
VAEYAKDLDSKYRKTIKKARGSDRGLRNLEKAVLDDPASKSLIGTTQAIDIISGGVKANALPESAWALVNHRISVIR